MKKAKFLTPVITAFDANGELDIEANKRIWEHLIKGGIDGVVLLGSTGEFFSMTIEQKYKIIEEAANYMKNRVKLYVGTACNLISETIELSNFALKKGAEAVMVIGPYYFSLSNESIEYYFDTLAKSIDGNIYLYNFPDRTGYDLNPDVTLKLLRKNKNIVGYKDTVSEMGHTRELLTKILKEFPNFEIFCGFDENFVHNMLSGGAGCIGGLSNLYPELFASWVNAINKKDFEKVENIQKQVNELMSLYTIGIPFIPILKRALQLEGLKLDDFCIKPLLETNFLQEEEIKKVIGKYKIK